MLWRLVLPSLLLSSASVVALQECDLDTIYAAIFDSVGTACVSETGIDTTKPWDPSPDDLGTFCGNNNCKAVNQRIHDAYPDDCYITGLGTNLLHGLFGALPCMVSDDVASDDGSGSTTSANGCPDGQYQMSVEGIRTIYCISGTACAGDVSDGVCPGRQAPDLPYGSTCGLVRTNVYGCKPYLDDNQTSVAEMSAGDLINCSGHPGGNMPVSVAGAGTFCGSAPVCSGTIYGNCPGELSGLTQPARCDYVREGVYGCTVLP